MEAFLIMKTLTTRAASALVAVISIVLLIVYYGDLGLKFLCYMAAILGIRELIRIVFLPTDSIYGKFIFSALAALVFVMGAQFPEHSTLGFAVISLVFCSLSILFVGHFQDLSALFHFQAKSVLGFFYVGLLPALAYRIVLLPSGNLWFLTMLGIVFAGDTFAYVFGMLWGKRKILPQVSPKKTLIGSLGGLLGSMLAGAVSAGFFLTSVPIWMMVVLALVTGVLAQLGDLFESMMKRIANRKDSGSIMPGHGGVLDRLDGVLFGAPIVLAGALLIEKILH